jgi:hypothetical protein
VRITRTIIYGAILSLNAICAPAQQPAEIKLEQRVPLTEPAVALDAKGAAALEGTLRTTVLNGAPDTPVTNIRVVIKNVSPLFYGYVSGLVTLYDGAGVRCGEGIFKADELSVNESVETDTPGIRIRCAPATWRIVATNLVMRSSLETNVEPETAVRSSNLIISIDGEEHPIQLDKPMILNLGDKKRTIVVRRTP